MNGLNSNTANGIIGPELKPDSGPATLSIKVSHGLNEHEVAVPSNSTFGDLKSVIVQKMGLKPETHKLLFRGKEKEDDEFLQTAGMKDNSKVLLVEDSTCRAENPEEVKETSVVSRGGAAVAEVKEEVDKLADQVAALQAVVDSGTKVDNKDIIYVTEMLMRQLLKLDGIDAEGEGRVLRKMEVRRVQSFVETMDILKSKNSNPFIDGNNNVSVTTQWEAFETGSEGVSAPPQSSSPFPNRSPAPAQYSSPSPNRTPSPAQSSSPSPTRTPLPTPVPSCMATSTPLLSYIATPVPLPSPAPTPSPISSTHSPVQSSTPIPNPVPSSPTTAVPFSVSISTPSPSSASPPMLSSTKVTQEWERFD